MRAYKGFNKDMTCRGFQFEEGKEYHEDNAEMCKTGFHACENPLDCWNYYSLLDSEYHEVELEELAEKNDDKDTKICGKRIKIGAKLDIKGIVTAAIDFVMESVKNKSDMAGNTDSGDCARIGSSGDCAKIGSSGDCAQIGSSGDCAQIGSSGNYAKIGSSGDGARIGSSGNYANIGSSGDGAKIGSSGDCAQIGSSGDCAQIGSSGNYAKIECEGENAVVAAVGVNSKIKASKGAWITLAEYGEYDGKGYPCKCVRSAQIDGDKLKADTWYKLENGEFVEGKEDNE